MGFDYQDFEVIFVIELKNHPITNQYFLINSWFRDCVELDVEITCMGDDFVTLNGIPCWP